MITAEVSERILLPLLHVCYLYHSLHQLTLGILCSQLRHWHWLCNRKYSVISVIEIIQTQIEGNLIIRRKLRRVYDVVHNSGQIDMRKLNIIFT